MIIIVTIIYTYIHKPRQGLYKIHYQHLCWALSISFNASSRKTIRLNKKSESMHIKKKLSWSKGPNARAEILTQQHFTNGKRSKSELKQTSNSITQRKFAIMLIRNHGQRSNYWPGPRHEYICLKSYLIQPLASDNSKIVCLQLPNILNNHMSVCCK